MVSMVSGVDTTGGWATAEAFSSGTQSSKLDLPTSQLFWSFTACSIERVAGCRLDNQLEFTPITYENHLRKRWSVVLRSWQQRMKVETFPKNKTKQVGFEGSGQKIIIVLE